MKNRAAAVVSRYFGRLHQTCVDRGASAVIYRFAPQFEALTSESSLMLVRGLSTPWAHHLQREQFQYRLQFPGKVLVAGRFIHFHSKADQKDFGLDDFGYLAAFDALQGGDGMVLPLYGGAGNDGICKVMFNHELSADDLAKVPALQMALHAIHLEIVAELRAVAGERVSLSPRELSVLQQIARGHSNRQIATAMTITSATVDTYVRRLFAKLDTNDRTEATLKALSLGMLRL